jgi:hypothetical protein
MTKTNESMETVRIDYSRLHGSNMPLIYILVSARIHCYLTFITELALTVELHNHYSIYDHIFTYRL